MKQIQAFVGCFFVGVAAFLYATKHITAAIISSNINTPNVNYYEGAYQLVGFGMRFWMIAALCIGIVLIGRSLIGSRLSFIKKQAAQKNTDTIQG
ncbi:hypothetical protein [Ferdinandcohnia sp. Marseille-Q9671]